MIIYEDGEMFNVPPKWLAEHDAKVIDDAITDFMCKALTKFYKFHLEHGYATRADLKDMLLEVANELKEKNNEQI